MPLSEPKKINPLSAHAVSILDALASAPMPRQEINPGVVRRLTGEQLAEIIDLPSPYKKHRGSKIAHLQITAAGHKAKAAAKQGK